VAKLTCQSVNMRYNNTRARNLEERIVGYFLINHPLEKYAFTNLTVVGRRNIEVWARQYTKNLRMVDSHISSLHSDHTSDCTGHNCSKVSRQRDDFRSCQVKMVM